MISIQQKVFNYLIEMIESGKLNPEDKLPAESELCKLFKASRNPVRKAYDELVHKEYVVRMPGLGTYVKKRDVSPKIINAGVILPGMNAFDEAHDPVAGLLKLDIFNGALDRAHEIGAKLKISPAAENWEPEKGVDGYLLLYYDSALLDQLKKHHIPCVSAHLGLVPPGISSVSGNQEIAFSNCFEYLISKGHRKIGLVDTDEKLFSAKSSFRKVMNKHSLPNDDSYIETFKSSLEFSGRNAFKKLIKRHNNLDAVFFRTDLIAIDALEYCRENGINVPDDISIMSYDNIMNSENTTPQLTTYNPMRVLRGYKAMEKLEYLIQTPDAPVEIENVEGRIVERESVKTLTRRQK